MSGGSDEAQGSRVPPHPLDKRWHVYVDNETYGPYTGHEIKRMVQEREITEDDLVYAEDGSDWQSIATEPVLGAFFKNARIVLHRDETRPKRSRPVQKWIFVTLILSAIAWIIWPYYAVYNLVTALRTGDVQNLEASVAWDSVRRGLKDDLNALLLRSLAADKKSDGLTGAFATLLGPAIVDRMIDSFLTPQAIAASSSSLKSENSENTNKVSDSIKASRNVRWDQIHYAFFSGSLLAFRVAVVGEPDAPFREPAQFLFQWGGSWKLTRVILPSDLFEQTSTTLQNSGNNPKSVEDAIADRLKKKKVVSTEVLQPLKIELVNKGFKAANFKDNDYQNQITFQLSISNSLEKDIRAFDGVVTFTDLLDNEIISLRLEINEPIKALSKARWSGAIDYNQFMDTHRRLRTESENNLKVRFVTRKVLFTDGTTKNY